MNIVQLGWNNFFQEQFNQIQIAGGLPARISAEHRGQYLALAESGELQAEVTGALRYACTSPADFPKVGDWVLVTRFEDQKALIHKILPRQNTLSRKKAGTTVDEQVLAANISLLGLVMGLDHDYNLRRLERYVALANSLPARLLVVLNKADLAQDITTRELEVKKILGEHQLLTISALRPEDIAGLKKYFTAGETAVFLGSSGAGKSTIINGLCGKTVQKTGAVREDDSRGRHITTTRELFVIEPGFCVIDTPGIRELQLWTDEQTVAEQGFPDIAELARHCRFADCQHNGEPGCAVAAALAEGTLAAGRWENFLKLRREQAYLETKVDDQAFKKRKQQDRNLHRQIKNVLDLKYGKENWK